MLVFCSGSPSPPPFRHVDIAEQRFARVEALYQHCMPPCPFVPHWITNGGRYGTLSHITLVSWTTCPNYGVIILYTRIYLVCVPLSSLRPSSVKPRAHSSPTNLVNHQESRPKPGLRDDWGSRRQTCLVALCISSPLPFLPLQRPQSRRGGTGEHDKANDQAPYYERRPGTHGEDLSLCVRVSTMPWSSRGLEGGK